MIKNIKLFINDNDKAIGVGKIVREKFEKNGYVINDEKFDLGIAVGGDGSFLRMVKNTKFDSKPYYVGINAGTLGFMQEVKPDEVDNLIAEIKSGVFKVEEIGIQKTNVLADGIEGEFYSLNEVLIKDANSKVIKVDVKINDDLLEKYTGDGLLIATSYGSTAHNLSYGGSIVYPSFSSLQITPVGPVNSKVFRTLPNSVVLPNDLEIKLIPNSEFRDFVVTVDGVSNVFRDVSEITTSAKDKKIKMLRFSHYNFPQKINEKLLDN